MKEVDAFKGERSAWVAGIEFIKLQRDRHAGSLTKEGYPASHECCAGHR